MTQSIIFLIGFIIAYDAIGYQYHLSVLKGGERTTMIPFSWIPVKEMV